MRILIGATIRDGLEVNLCPSPAGGLGDGPRRIFEELGKISLVDVVLGRCGTPDPQRRGNPPPLRPTDHQAILLDRLSPTLPRQVMSWKRNAVKTFGGPPRKTRTIRYQLAKLG